MTKYTSGKYKIKFRDGEEKLVELHKYQAKAVSKLMHALKIQEIELTDEKGVAYRSMVIDN